MLSDSSYLKLTIALSALLHLVILGWAHTVEAPAELSPISDSLRRVATVQLEPSETDQDIFQGRPVAFIFDQAEEEPAASEDADKLDEPELVEEEPAAAEPEPEKVELARKEPAPKPEPESAPEPEKEAAEPAPIEAEIAPVVASNEEDAPEVKKASAAGSTERGALAMLDQKLDAEDGRERAVSKNTGGGPARAKTSAMAAERMHGDQKKLNRQYGRTLFSSINAAKSYPMIARRAGIEGRLLVAITVDRHGKVVGVELRESSGHSTLDDNALATIRGLGKLPIPPNGLSWAQKTFVLPMNYSLQ